MHAGCAVPVCDRKHFAKSYCKAHYYRWRRTGDAGLSPISDKMERVGRVCSIEGCERAIKCRGYCNAHYFRSRSTARTKKPIDRPLYPKGSPRQGGRWKTIHGYIWLTLPGSGRRLAEHRWVMEQHIGRRLLSHETVHHKNGVRDDNRIENLELWVSLHPAGQRVEDLVAFAKDVLARYG